MAKRPGTTRVAPRFTARYSLTGRVIAIAIPARALCRSTGAYASQDTFGHGGSQSSVGFCDPLHRLTICIFCNTRPGPKHHYERMCAISTAIYEDLGLQRATGKPLAPADAASGGGGG